MLFSTLFTAALAPLGALAAVSGITITNPTASRWWIAGSQAELAWTGDFPKTDFTLFVVNDDVKALTTRTQLTGFGQSYQKSVLIPELVPGVGPGTGFVVQICDPLNNTDIWASSEKFEIKAKGSPYPTTPAATPSATASAGTDAAASNGTTTSGGAPAATTTGNSGAAVVAPVVAVAAAGALSYLLA